MQISIKIIGLTDTILNMGQRSRLIKPGAGRAIRDVLTDTFRDVQNSFDQSRQIGGRSWVPLAASTLAQKRRLGYSSKPLIRSGALRSRWDIRVSGLIGTLALLATGEKGVPYGVYQHEGTRTIPSRKFTPTEAVIRGHLRNAFKRLANEVAS